MAELYTYAASRIHAREGDLLTAEDLEQLMAAPNYTAALRILSERGCGSGAERSFEEIREYETDKLWKLVRELVPDTEPFLTLLHPIDFHNLKAAIKAVYASEKPEAYFKTGGTTDPQRIYEAVSKSDHSALPEFLRDASIAATEALAKTGDGRECDIIIDRECLEAMLRDGKSSGAELLEAYSELTAALSNIKIAVRGAKMQMPLGFFERALAECDSVDKDALAAAASKGTDELLDYLEHTAFGGAAEIIRSTGSMAEFEKWGDNRIMALIRTQKSNPFTIQPVIAFVLAKLNELKAVQIILSGKYNGLSDESIRERIRDLYV